MLEDTSPEVEGNPITEHLEEHTKQPHAGGEEAVAPSWSMPRAVLRQFVLPIQERFELQLSTILERHWERLRKGRKVKKSTDGITIAGAAAALSATLMEGSEMAMCSAAEAMSLVVQCLSKPRHQVPHLRATEYMAMRQGLRGLLADDTVFSKALTRCWISLCLANDAQAPKRHFVVAARAALLMVLGPMAIVDALYGAPSEEPPLCPVPAVVDGLLSGGAELYEEEADSDKNDGPPKPANAAFDGCATSPESAPPDLDAGPEGCETAATEQSGRQHGGHAMVAGF